MVRTKEMHRRDFLKKSGIALGASAGFPFLVPKAVSRTAPAIAVNDQITVGFIGLGNKAVQGVWGSSLASFLRHPGCRVVAGCDVDRRFCETAKNIVDDHYDNHDFRVYGDFRDLLARQDIDAVVISTPDHWHAIQCIEACRQGKDVYCEKPLSLTIREGRAMVDAARSHSRVVQTGSQSRSNTRIKVVCQLVREGRIGKLKKITAASGGPSVQINLAAEPTPDYLDWDMWLGPAPWRPFNHAIHPAGFRAFTDYSGGGVTDWGAHHFDMVQWALGADDTGPIEVIPPEAYDGKRLLLRYANGVEVEHIDLSREPSEFFGVTFYGTEGTIAVQGISAEGSFDPPELARECSAEVEKASDLYANSEHYDNFLQCVRSRKKPVADIGIGFRSVSVCHITNIGYWLKRPLKWDPDEETFPGDAEANRYLSRAICEPWSI